MNSTEMKHQLEDRTVTFSVNIVIMLGKYSEQPTLRPLVIQIIRSATSVGANYAEANNGSSRADFKNKLYISKKEAAETVYWLRVLKELIPQEDLTELFNEATALYLILQKATNTMKAQDNVPNTKS